MLKHFNARPGMHANSIRPINEERFDKESSEFIVGLELQISGSRDAQTLECRTVSDQ